LGATFTVTAVGAQSTMQADVEFTDDAAANVNFATNTGGLPAGTSVSVTWSGTNNGGNPVNGPTAFSAPGPSTSQSLQPGSSLTFTFPATITVGANTFNLV